MHLSESFDCEQQGLFLDNKKKMDIIVMTWKSSQELKEGWITTKIVKESKSSKVSCQKEWARQPY